MRRCGACCGRGSGGQQAPCWWRLIKRGLVLSPCMHACPPGSVHACPLPPSIAAAALPSLRRLGDFNPPASLPWAGLNTSVIGQAEHAATARQIAAEGTVLLKNEGVSNKHSLQGSGSTAGTRMGKAGLEKGCLRHASTHACPHTRAHQPWLCHAAPCCRARCRCGRKPSRRWRCWAPLPTKRTSFWGGFAVGITWT